MHIVMVDKLIAIVVLGDFLYAVDGLEMGVTIQSDLYDDLSLKIDERTPRPTAAAVLRDLIEIQSLTR